MQTTKQRVKQAGNYFFAGYNCAQAVAAAFTDVMELDEKTVLMLASSFGGGVGRLREICGAVSGMALVAGKLYGEIDPADDSTKAAHYELVQKLATEFDRTHGSLICRDLLDKAETTPQPDKRTKEYYETRPCTALVEDAARIMNEYLLANPPVKRKRLHSTH